MFARPNQETRLITNNHHKVKTMELTTLLFPLIAFVLGITIGCLIFKSKNSKDVAVLNNEIAHLQKQIEEETYRNQQELLKKEEECSQQLNALETKHDELYAEQDKRHQDSVSAMKETFSSTINNLKTELKAVTEDMLKQRQQEFSNSSRSTMQDIISPLNQTIDAMKLKMEEYSKEQGKFSGSMEANIQAIIRQTEAASKSAEELTTALKHSSKVQGDYGELVLSELLTSQGLIEGIHYVVQYTEKDENGLELKDENGQGLRPDIVLHLDTKRDVIIDSKLNLTDFTNFANAQTQEERDLHLAKHIKSMENQVKLLSSKNYTRYHKGTNARMDYVIMFVPISAALWEALRHKRTLWREAMEKNVFIADEQTLYAALRIIRLTWTQIEQMNSQQEIFNLANEMLNRVNQFLVQYRNIGGKLKEAQSAYEQGLDKLTPGGYSIITTAKKLVQKGAKASKSSPLQEFIDIDDVEQLPEPQKLD